MSDNGGPGFDNELSKRLSSVLEDIGVSEETVLKRRDTFLLRETNLTIKYTLNGQCGQYFHFGSQSEGTTTPGLQSDMDILVCNIVPHVMITWSDWRKGTENVLMLNDDDMPPQQYLLQVISQDSATPEKDLSNELTVRYQGESIILSSGKCIAQAKTRFYNISGSAHNAGPSASWSKEVDVVQALGVSGSLREVKRWINRGRPGHWPTKELFTTAQDCICFLVPAGHPFSDTRHIEWRLSPNLIERKLIFNMNITQIKCYIIMKMIKKGLLNSVVENGITSFHCKTILFYTLERTHARLWKEHNLAFLVKLCLHTLKRMLKNGSCPHYIIDGVNLFDGKLSLIQCRKLHTYVSKMIRNNIHELLQIDIDNLGYRLLSFERVRSDMGLSREQLNTCLRRKLDFDRISYRCHSTNTIVDFRDQPINKLLQELAGVLKTLNKYNCNGTALERNVSNEMSRDAFNMLASLQASVCIGNISPIQSHTLECFKFSFDTDVASSRLKLASALLCSGNLHAAAYVLQDVEKRLSTEAVKSICRCGREHEKDMTLEGFAGFTSLEVGNSLTERNIVLCVRFIRQELHCFPPILLFEMNREMTADDISQRNFGESCYMEDASVDAGVFLHYLQYLTHGGLGNREQKELAYLSLQDYILDHEEDMYHTETGFNLLGHCAEMEGDFEMAVAMYMKSLEIFPTNNAAHWHMLRRSGK